MIVAVPVYDDNKKVSMSFGRSPEFLFYNTETEEKNYVKNPAADAQGGAGIKAASYVADEKAGVLLTPRLGQNSADVLVEAGLEIYKTESEDTDAELKKYKDGTISKLLDFHAGFHGHQ